MKLFWFIYLFFSCGPLAFGHGRSEEMITMLNSEPPSGIVLVEKINVSVISKIPAGLSLKDRSGGATNSQNRITITGQNIEHEFLHEIDYRGNSDEGYGVSLNAKGDKVLINSG